MIKILHSEVRRRRRVAHGDVVRILRFGVGIGRLFVDNILHRLIDGDLVLAGTRRGPRGTIRWSPGASDRRGRGMRSSLRDATAAAYRLRRRRGHRLLSLLMVTFFWPFGFAMATAEAVCDRRGGCVMCLEEAGNVTKTPKNRYNTEKGVTMPGLRHTAHCRSRFLASPYISTPAPASSIKTARRRRFGSN